MPPSDKNAVEFQGRFRLAIGDVILLDMTADCDKALKRTCPLTVEHSGGDL